LRPADRPGGPSSPAHRRAALAAVIAFAAALAPAPAAQGATVASQVECVRYLPGVKSFPLTATGFPAGAALTFKADGIPFGAGQADPAGNFDNAPDPFLAPTPPAGSNLRAFQITAEDGQGTVAGPIAVPVSRITVVAPANAKPSRQVRFRLFGFRAGPRTYLHVRRDGRTKGRFALGRTAAPCGTLTKRMRFMPLRDYRTGTYRYYFSHSRRFRRDQAIYQARVRIYRTFKPSASGAQATPAGAWG
jgi:hypothetical protein